MFHVSRTASFCSHECLCDVCWFIYICHNCQYNSNSCSCIMLLPIRLKFSNGVNIPIEVTEDTKVKDILHHARINFNNNDGILLKHGGNVVSTMTLFGREATVKDLGYIGGGLIFVPRTAPFGGEVFETARTGGNRKTRRSRSTARKSSRPKRGRHSRSKSARRRRSSTTRPSRRF